MTRKIGNEVKVSSDNDNECYDSFRDKTLVITHIAHNQAQHPGYDDSMEGMPLYDFEDYKTGEPIPCSLYEYEIEGV